MSNTLPVRGCHSEFDILTGDDDAGWYEAMEQGAAIDSAIAERIAEGLKQGRTEDEVRQELFATASPQLEAGLSDLEAIRQESLQQALNSSTLEERNLARAALEDYATRHQGGWVAAVLRRDMERMAAFLAAERHHTGLSYEDIIQEQLAEEAFESDS
jgi:hypothetical protein